MVLIVLSGLVKKYFWYIKACTYSSNLGQAPHCKSGTRAEGPGSLAPSTCPLPGPSQRRKGHGHWDSGRPQEGGAVLKLLTQWCHLVLRFLVPVACWWPITILCVSLWFIAVWICLIDLKITYMKIEGTELGEFKDPNQRGTYYCRLTFEDVLLCIRPEYILSHLSYVWLCDPMDCRPPGSSVHGILQARIREWVAILSSRGSSQPRDRTHVSCGSSIAGGFFTTSHQGSPCIRSIYTLFVF